MDISLVLVPLTFLVLFIASYTDLRTREVPDWLSYGFLFAVIGVRAVFSVQDGWTMFLSGILGLVVAFLLACFFYYTHQWGGGDSKLLMGMGAMIGILYPFQEGSFPFLWYFLLLLLVGAFYGVVWMLILALKQWPAFWQRFQDSVKKKGQIHGTMIVITIILGVLILFFPFLWPLLVFPLSIFYLLLSVQVIEGMQFMRQITISKLMEGDWLAENVYVNGNKVLSKRTLEKRDLTLLKRYHQEGKLDTVMIKEGIPFIPSFLLAYALLMLGRPFLPAVFSVFFSLKF